MESDDTTQSTSMSESQALFALNMYLNRFMWISTKEIVSGISSCYYNDLKYKKDEKGSS